MKTARQLTRISDMPEMQQIIQRLDRSSFRQLIRCRDPPQTCKSNDNQSGRDSRLNLYRSFFLLPFNGNYGINHAIVTIKWLEKKGWEMEIVVVTELL